MVFQKTKLWEDLSSNTSILGVRATKQNTFLLNSVLDKSKDEIFRFTSDLFLCFQAIVEGLGLAKGEIGMASIDMKKPELILSQVSYQNIMLQFIVNQLNNTTTAHLAQLYCCQTYDFLTYQPQQKRLAFHLESVLYWNC